MKTTSQHTKRLLFSLEKKYAQLTQKKQEWVKQESRQNKGHKRNRRNQSVLDLSITNICEHFAGVLFFN